ncbi:MAG: hypothetical protein PHV11_03480 [Candidatus Bipolaricaulis sp.]|nr:hypothetical protein [Candidatus Bipolaricaulis sp.]MDD5219609.1 hypothetical protein [Candidatus Bipolaricaulis sp.]MDD5645660.1 hypothetical protein [Candidatus Bipolaricaulis sp.]
MDFLRSVAYGTAWGPFPVVVWVGFATYFLLLVTAALASLKRHVKPLRRVPVSVHRGLGILTALLATFHLLLGLSAYL